MSESVPKLLKMTVISGGVLLIGGFLWVGAVIAQRASEQAIQTPTASACREISLPVPAGGEVEFAEGEWRVTTPEAVFRYDECGQLRQKATLAR